MKWIDRPDALTHLDLTSVKVGRDLYSLLCFDPGTPYHGKICSFLPRIPVRFRDVTERAAYSGNPQHEQNFILVDLSCSRTRILVIINIIMTVIAWVPLRHLRRHVISAVMGFRQLSLCSETFYKYCRRNLI